MKWKKFGDLNCSPLTKIDTINDFRDLLCQEATEQIASHQLMTDFYAKHLMHCEKYFSSFLLRRFSYTIVFYDIKI